MMELLQTLFGIWVIICLGGAVYGLVWCVEAFGDWAQRKINEVFNLQEGDFHD